MFERNGLLDFWIDREVFAVEVSQAVVLPLQQIAGGGLGPASKDPASIRPLQMRFIRLLPKSKWFHVFSLKPVLWCGTFQWLKNHPIGQLCC
ncbi:hypothetical protein C4K18_4329 [Pseudomonas chlororaphis subsp. aurantiaca]|nr:hypothetical protein C4K18_4329 [Pseudomonas chlororaphis subsp. aurantiaca]